MTELVHLIFVAPLIWVMRTVLIYSHDILYSYGLAIFSLSFITNIVLTPFYRVAQKWQQDDHEKQQRMAEKKADIKNVYQGRERFMMLQTLYRQYHYHPLTPLKSSLALLMQIPFFIAAYQLLTQFIPLRG